MGLVSTTSRSTIYKLVYGTILHRFTKANELPVQILGNSVAHELYHPYNRYQAIFFSLQSIREK